MLKFLTLRRSRRALCRFCQQETLQIPVSPSTYCCTRCGGLEAAPEERFIAPERLALTGHLVFVGRAA